MPSLITKTVLSVPGHPGSLRCTIAQFMCKCQVLADPSLGPPAAREASKREGKGWREWSWLLRYSGEETIAAAYGTGQ